MWLKPLISQFYNNSWINPTAIDKKTNLVAFIAVHFSELKKLKAKAGFSHINEFILERCCLNLFCHFLVKDLVLR